MKVYPFLSRKGLNLIKCKFRLLREVSDMLRLRSVELSRYVQSKNALNMINNDKFSCGVRHQAAFEFNFAHSLYATGDSPPGLTEDILMRL